MFPEQHSSIRLLEWITGDSLAPQMWIQILSLACLVTLSGFRVPNCKMGIIPPPTPQGYSNGPEHKHAMGLPEGQAKRKVFNQDLFFMIMNLVKTRNLKTTGIRERKEI